MSRIKRAIDTHRTVRGAELPARSAQREDGQALRCEASISDAAIEPLREIDVCSTPQANRGVIEADYIQLTLADGKLKQVLKRTAKDQEVVIDWLSTTVDVIGYLRFEGKSILTDDDYAAAISYDLTQIFGGEFAISSKNGYGMHFYKESYVIGQKWGLFCIGHRSNRFLLSISGEGWLHAPEGAAERMHDWLLRIDRVGGNVTISRVDLAVDFYDQGPPHEAFRDAYHRGEFVRQKRHLSTPDCWPHYQIYGCVHTKRGREKGITDAVGVRTGDLYLRRYDKGRAEGDPHSSWVRVELEMKSKDTVLPLDVLIRPEAYFCQYPWLETLQRSFAERVKTRQRRAEITVADSKRIIKLQFGKYLRVLRGLADSGDELLEELQSDEDQWPDRLAKLSPASFIPYHERHRVRVYEFDDENTGSEKGLSDPGETK